MVKKNIHINFKKDVPLQRSLKTNLFSSEKGTKFLKQQIVKKYGMGKRLKKKRGKTFWYHLNCSLASTLLFEGGRHLKEEKLRFSQNLSHFSKTLALLNLCGSFVRLTEFELRCEVYYVVSFKFWWTFVAFTVHEKTSNWLYADLVR